MQSTLRRIISLLIIGVIFYFLIKNLLANWQNIPFQELQFNFLQLILSFLMLFVTFIIFVAGWQAILRSINEKLGFRKSFWIMAASQMGKYAPGKIWFILGRIYMAKKEKLRGTNVALSILVETVMTMVCGGILVLASLLLTQEKSDVPPWLLFTLVIAGIMFLHPSVLNNVVNFVLRIFKKEQINIPISFVGMLILSMYFWGLWLTQIFGFFFLINSIYPISITKFANIIFIYTTSWIVGFLAPFAPGGLGVREGIMTLGLSTIMPSSLAVAISFLARIWVTVFELIVFVIGLLIRPKEKN